MKKIVITILMVCLFSVISFGQDTLYLNSGEKIHGKIHGPLGRDITIEKYNKNNKPIKDYSFGFEVFSKSKIYYVYDKGEYIQYNPHPYGDDLGQLKHYLLSYHSKYKMGQAFYVAGMMVGGIATVRLMNQLDEQYPHNNSIEKIREDNLINTGLIVVGSGLYVIGWLIREGAISDIRKSSINLTPTGVRLNIK